MNRVCIYIYQYIYVCVFVCVSAIHITNNMDIRSALHMHPFPRTARFVKQCADETSLCLKPIKVWFIFSRACYVITQLQTRLCGRSWLSDPLINAYSLVVRMQRYAQYNLSLLHEAQLCYVDIHSDNNRLNNKPLLTPSTWHAARILHNIDFQMKYITTFTSMKIPLWWDIGKITPIYRE